MSNPVEPPAIEQIFANVDSLLKHILYSSTEDIVKCVADLVDSKIYSLCNLLSMFEKRKGKAIPKTVQWSGYTDVQKVELIILHFFSCIGRLKLILPTVYEGTLLRRILLRDILHLANIMCNAQLWELVISHVCEDVVYIDINSLDLKQHYEELMWSVLVCLDGLYACTGKMPDSDNPTWELLESYMKSNICGESLLHLARANGGIYRKQASGRPAPVMDSFKLRDTGIVVKQLLLLGVNGIHVPA
jgi:hypothetical protein